MRLFLTLAGLAVVALPLGAQTTSAAAHVALQANKAGTLSVVVNSGGGQTTAIANNTISPVANPINVTTKWNVSESTTASVHMYGYFATPAQAMARTTNTTGDMVFIPSSVIEASTDNGVSWAAFSGSGGGGVGTSGGSLLLYQSPATTGAGRIGVHTQDVKMRYNLSGNSNIAAGTYNGTLNLQAVVF